MNWKHAGLILGLLTLNTLLWIIVLVVAWTLVT